MPAPPSPNRTDEQRRKRREYDAGRRDIIRAQRNAWYRRHAEEVKAYQKALSASRPKGWDTARRRAHRAANIERERANEQARRERNRERNRAKQNAWYRRNREQIRESYIQRAYGTLPPEWQEVARLRRDLFNETHGRTK